MLDTRTKVVLSNITRILPYSFSCTGAGRTSALLGSLRPVSFAAAALLAAIPRSARRSLVSNPPQRKKSLPGDLRLQAGFSGWADLVSTRRLPAARCDPSRSLPPPSWRLFLAVLGAHSFQIRPNAKKSLPGDLRLQAGFSGWADLNRRPHVPQTCTLNPCATARFVRCEGSTEAGGVSMLPLS